MKINDVCFIVNAHYEMIDDEENTAHKKPVIHYYGRLANGKSFEVQTNVLPYFYIKEQDELKAKKLLHIDISKTKLQTLQREPVVKVTLNAPKDVVKVRKLFEDNNIACFEADIKFVRKYFMDQEVLSTAIIQGESKPGTNTDLIITKAKISPVHQLNDKANSVRPSMLSFDIETNENATKIYSVSLYAQNAKDVIIVENEAIQKEKKINNATIVQDEKKLLEEFIKQVKKIDPDVIVGWNCIDFDLQVMVQRAKHHDIDFNIGRDENPLHLRIESSFFRDSNAYCHGRVILDGIHLLKSSFVRLDDYKLNTAAQHFLKDSKLVTEDDRFGILDTLYKTQPQRLIDYNLKDSQLVYDILEVSKVYELTVQRSLLTGLRMDEVKASIASFDSLYIRALNKEGFVAPTTHVGSDSEGLGGYVMNSQPGIYDHVIVLDFKSLYPSIMRTFNIDPLEYKGEASELKKQNIDVNNTKKYIIAPNEAVFNNNDKGILPQLLTTLWEARDEARKQKNELARYAIKILMNSMYGVLASQNSRFHIRNLSNAITHFAQHFIKLTQESVSKKGYNVIYGDTDSVFVDLKTKDSKQAKKIGKQIEQKLNEEFKTYIKEKYNRESILELEFEKHFVKFFMPTVRGGEGGAKKRYAGKKINGEVDFTGLEFVRRDWTEVSKEFQLTLLEMIFEDKPVEQYIKNFVTDLKKGTYDDLLIYKKALRKDLSQYTKTTPPHVKAARILDTLESNIISYVITLDGPQPIQKQTSPLDYDHYIEKQLKPIANSILELQGTNFNDVIKGSKQKGLSGFF